MTKPKQIYYRRKKDKMIIEEKVDGKTKYLKQLPHPEILLEILNNLNEKPSLKRKQCKDCNKPFRILKRGLCTRCYNAWRNKLKNPEYNKIYRIERNYGISYEKYKEITKRCRSCSETRAIHLHHLNMDNSDNNDGNLVGLCSKCHQLIHSEKDGGEIRYILQKEGFKKVLFGSKKKYGNSTKIQNNDSRLDIGQENGVKGHPKIRTTSINRTSQNDEDDKESFDIDEEIEELSKRVEEEDEDKE